VIVFFQATNQSFPAIRPDTSLQVAISLSYKNGTTVSIPSINAPGEAGAAVITEEFLDVNGTWKTSGASFASSHHMSKYLVTLDIPSRGVKGTISFNRVSRQYPSHPSIDSMPVYSRLHSTHHHTTLARPHTPTNTRKFHPTLDGAMHSLMPMLQLTLTSTAPK